MVLDNFLPEETTDQVLQHFPEPGQKTKWRQINLKTQEGRLAQQGKMATSDELGVHPVIRQLFWELNSAAFLTFLEQLTGISNLLPDPYLIGGGIHQTLPGGALRVHADFNKHPLTQLDRRLNLLIYLNRNWEEAYEGHLELWSKDMSRCQKRILPIAGRCMIFSTTFDAFHGHPKPLACPEGTSRKSLALYYYTLGRPKAERRPAHAPLWQTLPEEQETQES